MKKYLLLIALLVPIGCKPATAPTPPPPPISGALNAFDQASYQTLIAVQATLQSLNNYYKANPTGLASLKPVLDQAATDYNLAELTWQTYHSAATAANQAAVTASLAKVQSDLASVPK
jgi:hypothetical protein